MNAEVGIVVERKDDANGNASWSGTVARRWGDAVEETSETEKGIADHHAERTGFEATTSAG